MSVITLPYSMEQDRINQIKANSTHVDDNFNTLLNAVNGKLDLDGTSSPTSDISWNGHKITSLATPTVSGDAATKGYVDSALLSRAPLASPIFTGAPEAPTQSTTDDSNKIATTGYVNDVLEAIYPIGAVFIGTTNSCPMSAFFGTWELVATGQALWGGNGLSGSGTTANADYANAPANTTIAAGAPNIKGDVGAFQMTSVADKCTGAFVYKNFGESYYGGGGSHEGARGANLDASRSSSVYGKSTTIQPPAYVVNVWRRTA